MLLRSVTEDEEVRKAEEDRGKQPKRMVKVGTTGKRRDTKVSW